MPPIFLREDGGVELDSMPRAAGVSEQVQKPSLVARGDSGSGGCVWVLARHPMEGPAVWQQNLPGGRGGIRVTSELRVHP